MAQAIVTHEFVIMMWLVFAAGVNCIGGTSTYGTCWCFEAEAELRRYSGIGSHGGVLEVGNLNLQMSPTLLQQIHDITSCLCWTRSPLVPTITTYSGPSDGEPQPLPRVATGCAAPNSPDSQHASQPSPPRNIFPPELTQPRRGGGGGLGCAVPRCRHIGCVVSHGYAMQWFV